MKESGCFQSVPSSKGSQTTSQITALSWAWDPVWDQIWKLKSFFALPPKLQSEGLCMLLIMAITVLIKSHTF